MPKEKSRNIIYQEELEIVDRTQKVQNRPYITKNELLEEYRFISEKYKKLVNEVIKITRVGDRLYKKLMEANDQVEAHKNILENLTQQLLDANAAKDRFYSIIAHDLRNPLQVLLLSSEVMAENLQNQEKEAIANFIQKVTNATLNMSHLLDNLFQWGRSQYGEIECIPQLLDLSILANENLLYFTENAERKNIRLNSEIRENTRVFADENMIKTVLRNLINNAIKFTHPGGSINISSREEGDFIVTSVADTGVGIPQDRLKLLFQIGEHFTTKGTAKEKGSGLGLLLCKEFVEKNGGEIRVKSEEGKGSALEFSLPRSPSKFQNTMSETTNGHFAFKPDVPRPSLQVPLTNRR